MRRYQRPPILDYLDTEKKKKKPLDLDGFEDKEFAEFLEKAPTKEPLPPTPTPLEKKKKQEPLNLDGFEDKEFADFLDAEKKTTDKQPIPKMPSPLEKKPQKATTALGDFEDEEGEFNSMLPTPLPEEKEAKEEESIFSDKKFLTDLITLAGEAAEGYARAGSMARGGRGVDSGFYNKLGQAVKTKVDRDTVTPEEQYKEDLFGLKSQEAKNKKEILADEKDPDSEVSQSYQKLAQKMLPNKDLSNLSAFQLKNKLPQLEKKYNLERQAEDDQWKKKKRGMLSSEWERKEDKRKILEDPQSSVSKLTRKYAKQMAPEEDFRGKSAAELEQAMPILDKMNARQQATFQRAIEMDKARMKLKRKKFKDTQSLRKEYAKHPTTKSTRVVKTSYNKIKNTQPTGQGDLALVFSFMKMLDEGSVVRESEQAQAMNTGDLYEIGQAWYSKWKTGEKLTPSMRQRFKEQAKIYHDLQLEQQAQVDDQYKEVAEDAGFDWSKIGTDFGQTSEEKKEEKEKELKELRNVSPKPVDPEKEEKYKQIIEESGLEFPIKIKKDGIIGTTHNARDFAEAYEEGWRPVK